MQTEDEKQPLQQGQTADAVQSEADGAASSQGAPEQGEAKSGKDAESDLLAAIAGSGEESAPEEESADEEPVKQSKAAAFWHKYFDWKVKDIVFLAVISAAMLLTSAVMVFVSQVPVFGIAQVVTALQFSVFPAIGLMKVRKPGSIFFMALFTGVIMLFMAQEMFITNMISCVVVEVLMFAIFRGYKKDLACYLGAALFIPVSIPVYLGHIMIWGSESVYRQAATDQPWVAFGVSMAAVALAFIGAFVGVKIARELRKSGVLKK